MAKILSDLKVTELKVELESHELETFGKKSELVERLKMVLEVKAWIHKHFYSKMRLPILSISAINDDIFVNMKNDIFAIKNDISAYMDVNISTMENDISANMDEKISTMKDNISVNMDKISAFILSMKNDIAADVGNKFSSLKSYIENKTITMENRMAEKIKSDIEKKMTTLEDYMDEKIEELE